MTYPSWAVSPDPSETARVVVTGDGDRLRHDRKLAAEVLRVFAEAHRIPSVLFRGPSGSPVTVSDLLRQTAEAYMVGIEPLPEVEDD